MPNIERTEAPEPSETDRSSDASVHGTQKKSRETEKPRENLADFLLRSPLLGSDLKITRSPEVSRIIDFS